MMFSRRSRLLLTLAAIACAAGLGWLWYTQHSANDPPPPNLEDPVEMAELEINFDDGRSPNSDATMRFGLFLPGTEHPQLGHKRLSFDPEGLTSNACLKVDGDAHIFGHPPGEWVQQIKGLGEKRIGLASVWRLPDEKVWVTQSVEIVRGPLTGKLDTCQVTYIVENRGTKERMIGLRYLLDTFIGSNDAAPFVVPGRDFLCERQMQFPTPDKVPPFIFALEAMTLNKPGLAAQIGIKPSASTEAPVKLTLGGWPDAAKIGGAKSGMTLWNVPVSAIDKTNDAAAAIYWQEKPMLPGSKRTLHFTYGLSLFTANSAGTIGFFVAGDPRVGGELIVTALIKEPEPGQKVELQQAANLKITGGPAQQSIELPPPGKYPFSPVTWTLRPTAPGKTVLGVDSAGAGHEYAISIHDVDE